MWEKFELRLHLLLMLASVSLLVTSPWILMGRQLRASASVWDLWHVYVGLALIPLALLFLIKNCRHGQWRLYFPYLAGNFTGLGQDCRALARGKLPVCGGAGLFSVVEGLLLVSLLGCAITGGMWFVQQGGSDALWWRSVHSDCAWIMVGALMAHVVCAALHVIDMMR
ncbi:cytochrome b/b6 domain-containing protein [Shewanella sp. SNU WT4]|uniref:cytochrome b/b6 domain-containing protein n=1 Tax=Shewanella sp. SNU WT4 TaxID=2590015 RepID=UPI001128E0DA|nr:cytochrome b/b6 domain-containing protein [Shewanella sp. SNU WT4]QDF66146.1 cytochrome b/b6 domain-containing protein [Shewanella sp. SNU WT4]